MKSICIKTNKMNSLNYLLNCLSDTSMENISFSQNCFKHYKNIIIHYTGNDSDTFISYVSNLLSYLVIENYEEIILKRLIFLNYFYLDSQEKDTVLEICLELLYEEPNYSSSNRQQLLSKIFFDYFSVNKSVVLEGVINFRLKSYFDFLNPIVDMAVNQFIVEREYLEFISLLKLYISSEASSSEIVHLIYNNEHSTLLDENNKVIDYCKDAFNAKYLSDISFSSNDYTLNTLLNILPKKIYVHLSDNCVDEFISTLQLVFENRIELWTD